MSRIKKSLTNGVVAGLALMSLAVIAIWQFSLFVTFTNAQGLRDAQGGTIHLWGAIGAALIACIIGFLVFSVFVRYDKANEMHITS
jgi:hypothetical protein